jgi:hypothetical protein
MVREESGARPGSRPAGNESIRGLRYGSIYERGSPGRRHAAWTPHTQRVDTEPAKPRTAAHESAIRRLRRCSRVRSIDETTARKRTSSCSWRCSTAIGSLPGRRPRGRCLGSDAPGQSLRRRRERLSSRLRELEVLHRGGQAAVVVPTTPVLDPRMSRARSAQREPIRRISFSTCF